VIRRKIAVDAGILVLAGTFLAAKIRLSAVRGSFLDW